MREDRVAFTSMSASGWLWLVTGALFASATVLDAVFQPIVGFAIVGRIVIALSMVVLALGIAGRGSVTAARPLGTSALVAFAVVCAVGPFLLGIATDAGWAPFTVNVVIEALALALGTVATVQIGRVAVLPRPWNWAPFWTLVAVALAVLVGLLVGAGPTTSNVTLVSVSVVMTSAVVALAKLFLGVLLIVLADRRLRR